MEEKKKKAQESLSLCGVHELHEWDCCVGLAHIDTVACPVTLYISGVRFGYSYLCLHGDDCKRPVFLSKSVTTNTLARVFPRRSGGGAVEPSHSTLFQGL